jgi:hypothetical protein
MKPIDDWVDIFLYLQKEKKEKKNEGKNNY